jgi:hypothetical protein
MIKTHHLTYFHNSWSIIHPFVKSSSHCFVCGVTINTSISATLSLSMELYSTYQYTGTSTCTPSTESPLQNNYSTYITHLTSNNPTSTNNVPAQRFGTYITAPYRSGNSGTVLVYELPNIMCSLLYLRYWKASCQQFRYYSWPFSFSTYFWHLRVVRYHF